MEWLTSSDAENMEVDIGFMPQMELVASTAVEEAQSQTTRSLISDSITNYLKGLSVYILGLQCMEFNIMLIVIVILAMKKTYGQEKSHLKRLHLDLNKRCIRLKRFRKKK